MSHFSVMVVGNNVESLLAPFHEFECTGKDDEFVVDVDSTEEVKGYADELKAEHDLPDEEALKNALEYYGLENRVISDESEVDKTGDHKFGYVIVMDGKLVKAISRTNPEKKWDWWVVGGRWADSLVIKGGGRGNQSTAGNIDFDKMESEAAKVAAKRYDKVIAARAANADLWDRVLSLPSYEDIIKEVRKHNETADEGSKRNISDEYWSEDRRTLQDILRGQEVTDSFSDLREVMEIVTLNREEFIKKSSVGKWMTYALVQEGENGKPEWIARGKMGWFGMSTDETSKDEWIEKMTKHVRGLPSDTTITIVDCHI